ncbi:MAG: peptidase C45, partial [Acidobacteriota bacterium]|nr:peptidase C45 [Acidobacteriota bacterium]
MRENKGKIDVDLGKNFLADHVDSYARKTAPSERTLCGHVDLSPRGMGSWQPKYGTAGAVQNKIADAAMIERMSFTAAAGHACGLNFHAAEHLRAHSKMAWEKEYLRDMDSRPWTVFAAAR